ncbi:MAG: right-handed parallel beta-helix repeat-containing protein [Polyangiaceae bacterium]|nr:right-handed parallel beta-helix repeat-containing protein [Polyangiaceae bacterium]
MNKPSSIFQSSQNINAARRPFAALCLFSGALAVLSAGCGDDPDITPIEPLTPPPGCSSALGPSGGDDTEGVQTLLIEAKEGDTVCLLDGTYSFSNELSIATPGITLKGAGQGKTILDFKSQVSGANGIQITSDNVTVTEFDVKNTPGDGIRATSVKNIAFLKVSVLWDAAASTDNGAYGLYPVSSEGVRIEGCKVSGARDAGIYVGQSTKILVADSEAWGNVAGIELENSTDAEVRGCHAHDNTGGILVFNLPGLPMQGGKRAKVHNNIIESNNLDNFAEMGTTVARVPSGTGIMLLAADENEFHDNTIRNNKSIGVLIFSFSEGLFGKHDDPAFDIYPQANWFHDNTFENNGTMPSETVMLLVPLNPVPDIIWDGCFDPMLDNASGMYTNCLSGNGAATYNDMDYCSQSGGASGDISKVTCERMTLPTQDP